MVARTVKTKFFRFIRIVLDFIASLIGLRYPTNQRYLPPIDNRILLEPALHISQKIKTGKLKSEDVVRAYIDRCLLVQPHIRAIIQDSFSLAILEAKQVDKRVEHELDGNPPKDGQSIHSQPFLGVPFTTKDSISVKDMFLTSGLYTRKCMTATEDSEVISLMRKSGAIFIAMTNVPELVMWWDSYNKLYGRTFNPYDKSRICGGSSGGEGALLSSAGSVIGVGADIGGSIRMPCFFNGVFGHKTTPEVVSTQGLFPNATPSRQKLLSVGPMCRYATDLKPMLKVMAGENVKKLKLDQNVDINKLKVYFMEGDDNPLHSPLQSDIREAMRRVIEHFNNKGVTTKKVYFKQINHGFNIWMCAMEDKTAPKMAQLLTNMKAPINPFIELIKSFFNLSNHTICAIVTCFGELFSKLSGKEANDRFRQMRQTLTKELHELLGDDGIFIYPTHPETAPKHNATLLKLFNISYTALFNPLYVAITAVPLGLSRSGLPIGVQIVASPLNDRLSIAAAEELEKAFGGWVSPTDINCQN